MAKIPEDLKNQIANLSENEISLGPIESFDEDLAVINGISQIKIEDKKELIKIIRNPKEFSNFYIDKVKFKPFKKIVLSAATIVIVESFYKTIYLPKEEIKKMFASRKEFDKTMISFFEDVIELTDTIIKNYTDELMDEYNDKKISKTLYSIMMKLAPDLDKIENVNAYFKREFAELKSEMEKESLNN